MSILVWDKPAQVMTPEEYAAISADGAPPGVYVPNMSKEDTYKWRARKIGGKDPRVEIRKTVSGRARKAADGSWITSVTYAQVVLIVRPLGSAEGETGSVRMSMNGTAEFDSGEWAELAAAVAEAREALE